MSGIPEALTKTVRKSAKTVKKSVTIDYDLHLEIENIARMTGLPYSRVLNLILRGVFTRDELKEKVVEILKKIK